MKKIILFLILTQSIYVTSQTMDSIKPSKLSVGVNFSPDYCYRLIYNDQFGYTASNINNQAKIAYTAGLNIKYKLTKYLNIETGILFSDKGQKASMSSPFWITPDGKIQPSSNVKSTYHYYYIDIPLKANMYILNKKIKIYFSAGISTNVFLGKKTKSIYTYSDGSNETILSKSYNSKNIPSVELAFLLGLGISYNVTNKIFICLEPTYKQFIRPLVDYPVSGYLYSIT